MTFKNYLNVDQATRSGDGLASTAGDTDCFRLSPDRVAPGWDASLLAWLAQAEEMAPLGKAVLSTYPPAFEVKFGL